MDNLVWTPQLDMPPDVLAGLKSMDEASWCKINLDWGLNHNVAKAKLDAGLLSKEEFEKLVFNDKLKKAMNELLNDYQFFEHTQIRNGKKTILELTKPSDLAKMVYHKLQEQNFFNGSM